MPKLYPPNIAGTIPSFYSSTEGTTLVVPFSMNKTVSASQVGGFSLRVKTTTTDVVIGILSSVRWDSAESSLAVEFKADPIVGKLSIGKFYKIQLAYINAVDHSIGYYSTLGIVKYTVQPVVNIVGFYSDQTNYNVQEYIGRYSSTNGDYSDQTEKAYQYKFTLYNSEDIVLETSGWLLHNSYSDTELTASEDKYNIKYALQANLTYKVQYSVITNNGLQVDSYKYLVMWLESIDSELKATLSADLDYDNACVTLKLQGKRDENGNEGAATGRFLLSRASSIDNYSTWTEISKFELLGKLPSTFLFRDFTIEQGATYRYSLQQYNDQGIYSNRLYAPDMVAQFEDAYLYDGQRQLRIRFNPKVSSFKTVYAESKKNTLGSKYPFIFRNGAVEYKEFPISGLISYMMDNDEFFLSKTEDLKAPVDWIDTTDIVDDNVALERLFKLRVMEWLNDGNIKLFKSPAEGNYLVRLMNVSLAPNDTLSRMIHTFSCTAEEIADFTTENLAQYHLLEVEDIETKQMRWSTIVFDEFIEQIIAETEARWANGDRREGFGSAVQEALEYWVPNTDMLKNYGCYHIKINDCTFGTKFSFGNLDLVVGITGQYEAVLEEPLRGLFLLGTNGNRSGTGDSVGLVTRHMSGSLTYGIMSTRQNKFDTVSQLNYYDVIGYQAVGTESSDNILSNWQDFKHQVQRVYSCDFKRSQIQDIASREWLQNVINNYNNNIGNWYGQGQTITKPSPTVDGEFDQYTGTGNQLRENIYDYDYVLDQYIVYRTTTITKKDDLQVRNYNYYRCMPNGNSWYIVDLWDYSTLVKIDEKTFDLAETGTLHISELGAAPKSISIGNGITAELSFQVKEITYGVESQCQSEKDAYQTALEKYEAHTLGLCSRNDCDATLYDKATLWYVYRNHSFKLLKSHEHGDYESIKNTLYRMPQWVYITSSNDPPTLAERRKNDADDNSAAAIHQNNIAWNLTQEYNAMIRAKEAYYKITQELLAEKESELPL